MQGHGQRYADDEGGMHLQHRAVKNRMPVSAAGNTLLLPIATLIRCSSGRWPSTVGGGGRSDGVDWR